MVVAHAMTWNDGRLNDRYQFVPRVVHPAPQDPGRRGPPRHLPVLQLRLVTPPNLEISETLKAESPASVTIHGGPDTPKYEGDVEAYFRGNPHVDVDRARRG